MRVTKITSTTLPWTTVAQEKVSAACKCVVEIFYRKPHVLVIHKDMSDDELRSVIPENVPYTVERVDVPVLTNATSR
jgi:hypothetical protein